MIIPYGTDSAIYHWPIATGVLILVNIIAYPIQWSIPVATDVSVAEDFDDLDIENPEEAVRLLLSQLSQERPGWWRFALQHGNGLHPLQWLTSFFMHGSVSHLIGNMIFLWLPARS